MWNLKWYQWTFHTCYSKIHWSISLWPDLYPAWFCNIVIGIWKILSFAGLPSVVTLYYAALKSHIHIVTTLIRTMGTCWEAAKLMVADTSLPKFYSSFLLEARNLLLATNTVTCFPWHDRLCFVFSPKKIPAKYQNLTNPSRVCHSFLQINSVPQETFAVRCLLRQPSFPACT